MDATDRNAVVAVPPVLATGALVPAATVREEAEAARTFASAEKAAATRRAYRADWTIFSGWCAARGADPMPAAPEVEAAFLASQAL